MKNYKIYTGIDVSKSSLDYCILDDCSNVLAQGKTGNDVKSIKSLLSKIKKMKIQLSQVLFSFENTGIYSLP